MKRRGLLAALFGGTLYAQSSTADEWVTVTANPSPPRMAYFDRRENGDPCQPDDVLTVSRNGDFYCAPPAEDAPAPIERIMIDSIPGVNVQVRQLGTTLFVTVAKVTP